MKNLKLITALVLVLTMAFCATAGMAEGILAGKTVGFAQTDSMSSWRTTETDSIKEYVENAGGTFIVKDAGGDIATQATDVSDLVAANVDYLVVAPLEDYGLQGVLEESNVDALKSMVSMIESERHLQSAAQVLKMYDQMLSKATTEIGRIN